LWKILLLLPGFLPDISGRPLSCSRDKSHPLHLGLRPPATIEKSGPAGRRLFADVMKLTGDDMPADKQTDRFARAAINRR
jgi:hypothetical protein